MEVLEARLAEVQVEKEAASDQHKQALAELQSKVLHTQHS